MTDTQIIQSAYTDVVKKLFTVFFDSLATAKGNQQAVAEAADHFSKGVALARDARDQALRLVQQPD